MEKFVTWPYYILIIKIKLLNLIENIFVYNNMELKYVENYTVN